MRRGALISKVANYGLVRFPENVPIIFLSVHPLRMDTLDCLPKDG